MGLLDIFNGMQNARGGRTTGGGMSPIMMGLMGLLAYKAVKGFSNNSARPGAPGSESMAGGGGFGSLGDLFKGAGAGGGVAGLGGLGGMLSGGLGDLIKQFQGAGKGDVADSWVAAGQNKSIAPTELGQVLTQQQIDFLTTRTGLSKEELLSGLSQHLPDVVDKLTPEGRLPTAEEVSRTV